MLKKVVARLCVVAAITAAVSAQSAQTGPDPGIAEDVTSGKPPAVQSYMLGPNDEISVRCVNAEEFSDKPIRIDGDGFVTLPFVGRYRAGGLHLSEVQKELTEQLARFIREPQISVNLVEPHSQPVSIIGAVTTPGVQQIQGQKTLLEVLSMAGGLRPDAGRVVRITRRLEWGLIPLPDAVVDNARGYSVGEINAKQLVDHSKPEMNIDVRPHDVISVPNSEVVYVVGEVRKPGGFALHERQTLSVLQAISLAEGLERNARASRARILRPNGGSGRTDISVNLPKILSGHSQDIALQPEDILFIPNNAAKSAGLKAADAIIQLTTGLAVYGKL